MIERFFSKWNIFCTPIYNIVCEPNRASGWFIEPPPRFELAMTFPWKACFAHRFTGEIFTRVHHAHIVKAKFYLCGCRRQSGRLFIPIIINLLLYCGTDAAQYNSQNGEADRSFERFVSFCITGKKEEIS